MFVTTFLGHQGWMFQSDHACLLVDPLLEEEFGQLHALTRVMYPPRVFKLDAFPRVDAVVLTHEHDDHFDVPSLARLDRRIPIHLSARSSIAARDILTKMGFVVHPLVPGVVVTYRDLQLLPLCGDHLNTNTGDEWDSLPFVIRQTDGAGSFFSMVDCALTSGHIALARAFTPVPGLVGISNNSQDWSHMIRSTPEQTEGTAQFLHFLRQDLGVLTSMWGQPGALVLCAGGFSFYGERKWLNKRVFCVDQERVVKQMSTSHPRQLVVSARPGHTLHMAGNVVKKVDKQAPFLTTTSPSTWPVREKVPMEVLPDYAPATGRRELAADERPILQQRLGELAGAMVGGSLFKNLYSMLEIEGQGRKGTFAFVLRQGEKGLPLVLAYNPTACRFDEVPGAPSADDAQKEFIAGMECWAADLYAVLGGEMADIALLFGRATLWNALPDRLNFDLFGELQRVSGPLRRPAEYLRSYERILTGCAEVPPSVLHRGA
jgi:hypothetical protein